MAFFKQSYKNLKKPIIILVAGFLAFAPPGTLIGIFLLLTAFLGWPWLIAGSILLGLTLVAVMIIKSRK